MAVNVEPEFIEVDEVTAPATPASSKVRLYAKAGGSLYSKDDAGVETQLGGGSVSLNSVMCGRLTATTATPVTTADVLTVATIYYTPYTGNQISLYVSSSWVIFEFTERTLSLSGLSANTNYNIYIYDNAGTITLEASATGTVLQDGVPVKSGATERRLVGVVRITGTVGQTEDSTARRYINNYDNQVARKLLRRDTTNSWTYAVVAFRVWNNDSTNNRLEFVLSNNRQPVRLSAYGLHDNNGNIGSGGVVGIGIDSTTVNSADANFGYIGQSATLIIPVQAFYIGYPSVADHIVYPLETVTGAVGMRFYGDNGSTLYQTGFMGEVYG